MAANWRWSLLEVRLYIFILIVYSLNKRVKQISLVVTKLGLLTASFPLFVSKFKKKLKDEKLANHWSKLANHVILKPKKIGYCVLNLKSLFI